MANPEHVDIIKCGVAEWNEWRKKNRHIIPDLIGEDFSGAQLRYADFVRARLTSTCFESADIRGADFSFAVLNDSNLTRANLRGAVLVAARFTQAILWEAILQGTELQGASFWNANLSYANLSGAALINTAFLSASLKDVDFSYATFAYVVFSGIDLREAKNLESIKHVGPSSIGIDTIYKSAGNIPKKFLRGCGVPDDFITYVRSLTAKAIEFYSCFISYSNKDDEFAKRLYNDLQSEGVRCWFASEDLRIGDKFRVRIDESIRLYDKLVLVLSKNSVSSEWVGDEVEAALEKEAAQGGKVVLFPLRLDDAVMEIKSGWPAKVRRTRHIGDFSDWKNHDSYKKAFDRLMRDLKAGEKR